MTDRRILPGVNLLSRREREVIALVAQGLNNQEIGEQICVSPSTVRNHLRSIFAKLHVYGRVKLVLYVVNSGLVVETMTGECSHQP
jgi:DNA-binding NarL/FixJ family response regulator